ncbi:MAG: hypothetical protein MJY50_03905 [Bacteroidales bacterium]|nr:hypothetical protein [Bacteroidales bacterium]
MKRLVLTLLLLLPVCALAAPGIKNAADYGFRPGNSADDNATALQAALDGGGTIQVMVPGTYDLCGTMMMDSDTRLEFGAGVVENCYDLADPERGTTGFFCRILAGAWRDWESGMEFQRGDSVVSEGRIYRVLGPADRTIYRSTVQPTFAKGEQTLSDGVTWRMMQDHDIVYGVGCRNIHFKDIYLQKPRPIAFQLHFDKDHYSRSYYPDSAPPVQENMIFENIFIQAPVSQLIKAKTPINSIKLINSMLNGSEIFLYDMQEGLNYDTTHILMMGTTFKGDGEQSIVRVSPTRPADVKIIGSVVESDGVVPCIINAKVLQSDIGIKDTK